VDRVDERTDVFALGSILCEILTGQPAFTGRSAGEIQAKAARGDVAEALARLDAGPRREGEAPAEPYANQPPADANPPLDQRRWPARGSAGASPSQGHVAAIDPALKALCRDCLAAERDRRPRDASEVARRVAAHLAGVQDRLRRAELDRAAADARAAEERRKRRWQLGLAASVAGFTLLGAAGLAVFGSIVQGKNRALADANAALSKANSELSAQRTRAEDREQQAIDAVKRFRDAVVENSELKNNPALDGLRKALLKEPLAFFRSLRERLQADGDTQPDALARLASAAFDLGTLTDEIGEKQDALTAYLDARSILLRLVNAQPEAARYQSNLAATHHNLGSVLSETGEPAAARAECEAALAIWQRLAEAHPTVAEYQRNLARSHRSLGILFVDTGQPAEGRVSFEAARAILLALVSALPDDVQYQSELAGTHHNLGRVLYETGEPAAARAEYEAARAIWQRLAEAHPTVAEHQRNLALSHGNVGVLLSETGEPAAARAEYEAARAIWQRLAEAHPAVAEYQSGLASVHNNLGPLLASAGEPAAARAEYEAALAILRTLADSHPTVTKYQSGLALSHDGLGQLLHELGEPEPARAEYEAAVAIERRLADAHPESSDYASKLGGTLNNLARLDLGGRRFDAAADRFREAIRWQRKALATNPHHPKYRRFLRNHHTNLLIAARGLDDDALETEARRGLAELDSSDPRLAALDARLAAVLVGGSDTDNAERLTLAQRAYDTRRFALAARLWGEALENDAKLAQDRGLQHPYNAACAAALAASGQDRDEASPDDDARAGLRTRALGWLRGEVEAWARIVETGEPPGRSLVVRTLAHWATDPDLASVRGEAIDALPEGEREGWQALWADVERLSKRVGEPQD
jgi:tetratricopeptide (TPR) repeat protein